MNFTQDQHQVWSTLFRRQERCLSSHVSDIYQRGAEILGLPADHIPSLAELNDEITPRTGWRVVRTAVRYSDAVPWYAHFSRRQFMVTNYMRTFDELDFTPEPDMFHDIFGHLPFMVLPEYTELQEMFAPAFFKAGERGREVIKRLAWYSTEFGLILEDGDLKIFGAGLISSSGELKNVIDRKVNCLPFTLENVMGHEKAVWSFNHILFYFDSLDGLKRELRRSFEYVTQNEDSMAISS